MIVEVKTEREDKGAISTSRSELRVEHVAKSFRTPDTSIRVLEDVSFTSIAGETTAIMGASGAGKSTLLNLIGELETADRGTMRLLPNKQLSRPSFVFQFHYLLSDLNVLENVELPLLIERQPPKSARERALAELEAVGLTERLSHRVGELSGGEQQRVAIARALVTRPAVVLADEPTGNLDKTTASEIGILLTNYARKNTAIVLIATHNDHLARMCDKVLFLNNGRIETTEGLNHS